MPLPPDLAALIVSGNVSFMGQSARFSVMPSGPQGNEIGITFGEYPYLITSTFTPAASIGGVELRDIPQPDVEQFGVSAAIVTLELPVVTPIYNTADAGTDQFGVSAAIVTLELPVAAIYNTADAGTDQFGVSAAIVTLELPVTANYAEHELHDVDQFGVSAAINSLSLVTP
jgi:hypothetical protein